MSIHARENLLRLMAARGLTLSAVADLTGLHVRTVRGILRRLLAGLRPRTPLARELARLAADGFEIHAGSWRDAPVLTGPRLPPMARIKERAQRAAPGEWCGFQVYYAVGEDEVRSTPGRELVEVMFAVFDEVAPALSLCSQVPLPTP